MAKTIYVDNAATTAMSDTAIAAMTRYYKEVYGNPSSLHTVGQIAKEALVRARAEIAACIGAKPNEIYFTSGGSEADNQAIRSAAYGGLAKGKKHIISTAFEHHAVLHTLKKLEKEGFEVTYLNVHSHGNITAGEVEAAIRPDTALVTVMYANNEVGSVLPVREIGEVCRAHKIIFHTDAVQAYGHLPLAVQEYHIDLLSASAHKFNGPKGAGFLYVGKKAGIRSFIHGGQQERGRRAGTENVPGIVGMAAAARRAHEHMEERAQKERMLRDYLIGRIEAEIPDVALNGHRTRRLPNNVNFSFADMEGETMLIMLDMAQICASAGSACTSGAVDPSHVLLAMGLSKERARGSLRLTLSEENTREELDTVVEELDTVVEELARIVARVRGMMIR